MSMREDVLEFTTRKEVFNDYLLKDDSVLRVKLVLIKIKEAPRVGDKEGYVFNSSTVLGVIANKKLMGPPSSGNAKSIAEEDLTFAPVHPEEWNEYVLVDGTVIHMKVVIAKVSRLAAYDNGGCPLYHIQSQALQKVSKPARTSLAGTGVSQGHGTFVG